MGCGEMQRRGEGGQRRYVEKQKRGSGIETEIADAAGGKERAEGLGWGGGGLGV